MPQNQSSRGRLSSYLVSFRDHCRAALIEAQLLHVSAKPMESYAALLTALLGSWTLLDPNNVLHYPSCSSPFPHGELSFVEDKVGPPSRAYLKLWELFSLTGRRPKAGECVVDLGSSSGGWTWVLAQLDCEVISVDKAVLDPRTAALPNVEVRRESAFGLDPELRHLSVNRHELTWTLG